MFWSSGNLLNACLATIKGCTIFLLQKATKLLPPTHLLPLFPLFQQKKKKKFQRRSLTHSLAGWYLSTKGCGKKPRQTTSTVLNHSITPTLQQVWPEAHLSYVPTNSTCLAQVKGNNSLRFFVVVVEHRVTNLPSCNALGSFVKKFKNSSG